MGRASVGTAVVLMATGAVLAVAVDVPARVQESVDVLDLGLILIWAGILILVMQVLMHRRPPTSRPDRVSYRASDHESPDQADDWSEHDVHRPGYADETRRFPTVRDR